MNKYTWHTRWVCKNCGKHGPLPHDDMFFTPDVCPSCGVKVNADNATTEVMRYKRARKSLLQPNTWFNTGSWQVREAEDSHKDSELEYLLQHDDPDVRQVSIRITRYIK